MCKLENNDDSRIIENIKTTMAIERHFLSTDEVDMLRKCANNEINIEEAINSIKMDISSRMV